MSYIDELQTWYESQCDGRWEHQHGIQIGSLDNPGWSVEVDGLDESLPPRAKTDEESPELWFKCSLERGKFLAYGAPRSLEKIIQIFLEWTVSLQEL